MTSFESLVLGIVQGVTEFLPISSTAHLRIVPALLGWADPGAAYTAVLQLGSLLAVVGYFLPELWKMLRAALASVTDRSRPPERPARELVYLIVGTCRPASRASPSGTPSKVRCARCGSSRPRWSWSPCCWRSSSGAPATCASSTRSRCATLC